MTAEINIEPSRGWVRVRWRELWEYRELLYFLMWRDIKVRYKQSVFGAAWAVLQPLALMAVFTVFLGKLARVPSDGFPYTVFTYAALVPWTLFAQSLSHGSTSLVESSELVTKVYFPRLIVPIAAAGSYLIDSVIALLLLIALMAWYGMTPPLTAVWVPVLLLAAFIVALAMGIWLSALNVRYRDVQYAVPLIVQVWLFASPVAYSTSLVPERWHALYGLNPMVGVIEGFRWALLGSTPPRGSLFAASFLAVIVLMLAGLVYFGRVERSFADVV